MLLVQEPRGLLVKLYFRGNCPPLLCVLIFLFANILNVEAVPPISCTVGFCQNGGTCSGMNQCNCTAYTSGSDCSNLICPGNCNGRGTCVGPNQCSCTNPSYTGAACEIPVCNPGCQNYGTCTSPNVCVCVPGWQGTYCQIPICILPCQNGGTCMSANGSQCFCIPAWSGADCSKLSTTIFPGNPNLAADGTSSWKTSSLLRTLVPDQDILPQGFTSQPSALENCCPCGSFTQDGACYFLVETPSWMPYMEYSEPGIYHYKQCVERGGTLATFEKGNSMQKMANFFKWLATDSNIQLEQGPVDFNLLWVNFCPTLGIFHDNVNSQYYWESNPPVRVDDSLWLDGEPSSWQPMACAVPHKKWPKLRVRDHWNNNQPVICMIRNPCNQLAVCKPGRPSYPGSIRIFDRCYTTAQGKGLLDRMENEQICQAEGGFVPTVRQYVDNWYWAFGLNWRYPPYNPWNVWIYDAWIGLNHFKSDYYWDTANKQLTSPLHVDWNYATGPEPNFQTNGQCTMATPTGWNDQSCMMTANIACEGPVVDPLSLTTTSTTTTISTSTTTPDTTTTESTTTSTTTTAETTTTTTLIALTAPATVTCPTGYGTYQSAFDACYKPVHTTVSYLPALRDCVDDGGTFVNINSDAEFAYITSSLGMNTAKEYFIGLQDWVRRGDSTIMGFTYNGDSDGNWHWMDDSPYYLDRNTLSLVSSTYLAPAGPFNFTAYTGNLAPDTNANPSAPFLTWLTYSSSQWRVELSKNIQHFGCFARFYICEINYASIACPTNWRKYNQYCFKIDDTVSETYEQQVASCASLVSETGGILPTIWAPKTEGLLVFQRFQVDFIGADGYYWIGARKDGTGTYRWADDNNPVSASDALDTKSGEPKGGDSGVYTKRTGGSLTKIRDSQNGWLGGDAAVTASGTTLGQTVNRRVCQIRGIGPTTTSTTDSTTTTATTETSPTTTEATTTSTSTTTTTSTPCIPDGCCPCGWIRYSDTTANTDMCYYFDETWSTWQDAQLSCARRGSWTNYGAYLAVTDTRQKMQFLMTHQNFISAAYWTALAMNKYGNWTWPNSYGKPLSPQIVGGGSLPSSSTCAGAKLEKLSTNVVPVCDTGLPTYLPFICEIIMHPDYCPICKPPDDQSGLNSASSGAGSSWLRSPLRVSPDKCVWIFQEMGTRTTNVNRCKAAGLQPLNLYQAYESQLVKSTLATFGSGASIWLDLVMRTATNYTWAGESSTYMRFSNTPTNTWHQACASVTNGLNFRFDNCLNKRAPMCQVPSAAKCSDLCPFGFTAIGGSCFLIDASGAVSSPFTARQRCLQNHGTYTLASIASDAIMSGLVNLIKTLQLPPGTSFWIGLDDSLRQSHGSVNPAGDIVTTGDPDGNWEMDNTQVFNPAALSSFWTTSEPISGNHWAYLTFNGSSINAATILANGAFSAFYICERPKPCLQCDSGWTYFNGHCYYTYQNPAQNSFRDLRGFCDFQRAYVVSIGSPIEDAFIREVGGSWTNVWIGFYRTNNVYSPFNETSYEWDEGGRFSDTKFSRFRFDQPSVAGQAQLAGIMESGDWNDKDPYDNYQFIICEKTALIPTLQCPYVVSAGVVCGDNLISPQFTDTINGYTASSFLTTAAMSYPPNGIVLSTPWCPDPSDLNPWIMIDFGSNPVYVRAISTLGGQAVAGMVTAYTVSYAETSTATAAFMDIFVHKSVTVMTKMAPIVFSGNAVASSRNPQEICPRIRAYRVKVTPKGYYGQPFMRIELKGCSKTVNVPAFCECWVESFEMSWQVTSATANPFYQNWADADSTFTSNSHPGYGPSLYRHDSYRNSWSPTNDWPTGWTPFTADDKNWYQVTFSVLKVVTGIVLTGHRIRNEYITSYNVQWSHTGYAYTFNYYNGIDGQPKLFAGPLSSTTVTQQSFCPPMKTIALKMVPVTFVGKPSLVLNVFACMARGRRCFDCCDELGLCNCNCPVGWTGTACATVSTDRNYFIDAPAPVCETVDVMDSWSYSLQQSSSNAWDAVQHLPGYLWWGSGWNKPGWSPASWDSRPYWGITFDRLRSISVISVAGNPNGFVSFYNLWFRVQGTDKKLYYPVLDTQNNPASNIKMIPGARESTSTVYVPYYFCPNIRTDSLRIQPIVVNGTEIRMYFKINGCPAHAPCSTCCTNSDGCQCKCPVGFATNDQTSSTSPCWERCDKWNALPVDCEDHAIRSPGLPSGIYTIYPPGQSAIRVFCEMTAFGGGWTVIQNRVDNTQDFYKNWNEYKDGFGNLDSNFWLGNENIRMITASINTYNLIVKLTAADDQLGISYYSNFYIDPESAGYKLHLNGDACNANPIGDSLVNHANNKFFTKDNDTTGFHCAATSYGGWWYKDGATSTVACHDSNLNGYLVGSIAGTFATWKTWRGYSEPMKKIQMLIRRSPLSNVLPTFQPKIPSPVDCEDILATNPQAESGVYKIYPVGGPPTGYSVFCEMVAQGGGWTVIQRHYDSSVSFNRGWLEYESGFGSLQGNHYLGNEKIYTLTNFKLTNLPYQLSITVESTTGDKRSYKYPSFWLNLPDYSFGYSGGDNDYESAGDAFAYSNGKPFQTYDMSWGYGTCSNSRSAGWWYYWPYYRQCSDANLNGLYGSNSFEGGMFWSSWKGRYESMKATVMMIKRSSQKPVDCEDINNANIWTSGIYWIYPYGMDPVEVYCDMSWYMGDSGWTLIQRRKWGNANFSRTWSDYKQGFWADPLNKDLSDYWLGNENIFKFTRNTAYSVLIGVRNPFSNSMEHSLYSDFKLLSENDGYTLFVSGYSSFSSAGDSLSWHNGWPFSTVDNGTAINCAKAYTGGGWYPKSCGQMSNLNGLWNTTAGVWARGITWRTVAYYNISMLESFIAIRRKSSSPMNELFANAAAQICRNSGLSIYVIYHTCQHGYQQISGDNIRVMDSNLDAAYSGEDLICKPFPTPMDCSYFQTLAPASSKYLSQTRTDLYVPTTGSFSAYCDMESMGGGWTVIQRRLDDTQSFLQDIIGYELSFGAPAGNFWLGNSIIRGVTATANYELLVEMKTNLTYAFALYSIFYTTSEVNNLHISGYKSCSTAGDSLSVLNTKPFVFDNCGSGAWWYYQSPPCYGYGTPGVRTSNLNAPYGVQTPLNKSIYWWTFGSGYSPTPLMTSMKIRRTGTNGRYIMAANFRCTAGTFTVVTASSVALCQDACTVFSSFSCLSAVYDRNSTCIIRNDTCAPGVGVLDSSYDTYFRMDSCSSVSNCGPPPTMYGTKMEVVNMPTQMSVNYTCRNGFTNALWPGDNTLLTCNTASKLWTGLWLDCKTLCGDVPDLSLGNIIQTNMVTDGITITVFYSCQADFEWLYGDLTRVCAPPYGTGNWLGSNAFCNTTRCDTPPTVPYSTNNFTVPTPAPTEDLTKRFAVWSYTCNVGFVFLETMTKTNLITCREDKLWSPPVPGTCVPFRCENPPIFPGAAIAPTFTNSTYFDYGAAITYQCYYDKVLDPLHWDSIITIACIGNQSWSVINYAGLSTNWLPSSCVVVSSLIGFDTQLFAFNGKRYGKLLPHISS